MTLVLAFAGFVQVRLATNPDPTDEPRGVSGYTFALPGEPDLDRVVRTSNPRVARSHGPAIGVTVRAVSAGGVDVPAHPLIGAALDLLGEPKFESVNEVVMEQGTEILEPFDVQLVHGGFRLQRRAFLDPARPDLTVYTAPRALLDARKATYSMDTTTMIEAAYGTNDPAAFRSTRLAAVETELAAAKATIPRDAVTIAALERRASELRITGDRRTGAMKFIEYRHFDLNGPTTLVDPAGWLAGLDAAQPFACDVAMGAWDADALAFYATGTLALPTS